MGFVYSCLVLGNSRSAPSSERPAVSDHKIISRMCVMRIIGLDLSLTSAHKAVIMDSSGMIPNSS